MQKTALFAAEALGDAEILLTVLKDSTNRLRPRAYRQTAISPILFRAPPALVSSTSFPSGHAIFRFRRRHRHRRRYGNTTGSLRSLWRRGARRILQAYAVSPFHLGCLHGRRPRLLLSRFVVLHE